jgi:hypothetical protein
MFAVKVSVTDADDVAPTVTDADVLPNGDGHETYTVAEPDVGPLLYSVTVKFTAPVYT